MADHTPITVTILSLPHAAAASGWDEGDLLHAARNDGVVLDANDDQTAAVFGISPYYLPDGWVEERRQQKMNGDG